MTVTRVGTALALVMLLLPDDLGAQRIPLPGTRRPGPARPAPLPPQPEPIARNLAYKRLRISVESYPLISYVRAPGFADGPFTNWTSLGAGTRADYRLARNVSLTFDVTSSFAGGPANVHTAELGTRLGRERYDRRLYPFLDLRVGYAGAYSNFDAFGGFATGEPRGFQSSEGFGGVAGVGAEYTLTRTLSLTTAASVMRTRMTTRTLFGAGQGENSFSMTFYRYTIGLRWNPVRVIRVPGTDMY
jgi:hypothetical protein